jgi:RNA polymerase sigma factor (sigma-70 family)
MLGKKKEAKIVYIAEKYCAGARRWRMAMSRAEQLKSQLTQDHFMEIMRDPANKSVLQPLLRRHSGIEDNPDSMFIAIGYDLVVGKETERAEALWALKALMPELDEILHVRKRTQEDFIEHLFKVLVTERRFSLEKGKDPRPYVRRIAKNWNRDGSRKEDRIVSLDKPLVRNEEGTALRSLLPNPTSIEDDILDHVMFDEFLAKLDFLSENEKSVIVAAVANLPTKVIARELGITESAVSRLKSRAKRKILGREEFRAYIEFEMPLSEAPFEAISIKELALIYIQGILLLPLLIIARMIMYSYRFVRRMLAKLRIKRLRE